MPSVAALLLLPLLLLGLARASTPEEAAAAGVLILDDSNFDEELESNPFLLVEFYAPWCGHCKTLAPEWIKAAKTLAASGSIARLGQVDATEAKSVADRFEVKGFPTIKLFKNGVPSDYEGGRTEAEIVSWTAKRSGPPAKELFLEADLIAMQAQHDALVVGHFADLSSDVAKAFEALADKDPIQTYAITSSDAVMRKLGVTGDGLVVLKTFDELRNELPLAADFDSAAAATFVADSCTPLVQTFSDANAKKIFSSVVKLHALFMTVTGEPHHATIVSEMSEAAKELRGKILAVNVPSTETKVIEFFGFKTEDLPKLVIVDMGQGAMKKYGFEGEITTSAVLVHANSVLAGNAKPTLKTEEPQPSDLSGDVKVLRGSSFMDVVINNSKDVLVEFYAPWCGHCKQLEPIFNELAGKLKGNDNVVIAKMDTTANEIDYPGVDIKGFPTLYFFKGDDKTHPVLYDGERQLPGFMSFLQAHVHHAISDEL